jgi:hypothetical protein
VLGLCSYLFSDFVNAGYPTIAQLTPLLWIWRAPSRFTGYLARGSTQMVAGQFLLDNPILELPWPETRSNANPHCITVRGSGSTISTSNILQNDYRSEANAGRSCDKPIPHMHKFKMRPDFIERYRHGPFAPFAVVPDRRERNNKGSPAGAVELEMNCIHTISIFPV